MRIHEKYILFLLFAFSLIVGCSNESEKTSNTNNATSYSSDKIGIFVSILPEEYFVRRIIESIDRYEIHVMVGPGQSPHTYEPTPSQMTKLMSSRIYFSIGVTFENAWMERIKSANPKLQVVDLRKDITLRDIESHQHNNNEDADHKSHEKDPHIWMNPQNAKIMAKTIADTMSDFDPDNSDKYLKNYEELTIELDELDSEIKDILSTLYTHKFLLYHPSLGYFADRYNLKQIPVEIEGKEPGAKDLEMIFQKHSEVIPKVIFIQEQISSRNVSMLQDELGLVIVKIDPLSNDYINNLREIAKTMSEKINAWYPIR